MESQPLSPRAVPPPLNVSQGGTEDNTPTIPPPPHLLLPHLHPPPHLPPPPPLQFPMPYHTENMPPSLLHQPPPPSPCFSTPPPIPRPPPPPISQHPTPNHPVIPSAVMVGGVLVPVDHPHSLPPPVRPEGADHGGVGHRGGKIGPPLPMSSLLGEPPKLPRPGTVKEPFLSHPAGLLHRPGAPAVQQSLLGRVKEPLALPLPSPTPSPTSATTSPSTPNSPAVDTVPTHLTAQSTAPPLLKPPTSPSAQPRKQAPVPLLDLPSRPPILSLPISHRPMPRGRAPSQHQNRDHGRGGFRGGKRSGPPFSGGPFHSHKRPYLPPRY